MGNITDVLIVGAGPYGLSLAAHLSHANVSFRIFGKPLDTWRHHVPRGMKLKSEGFASSLSSPVPGSSLEDFCAANGLSYADQTVPVELDRFNTYATWFQKTFVPTLDTRNVINLMRHGDIFTVTLEDGEIVHARRVVLAVGITHFANLPKELEKLPAWAASHSFAHHDVSRFEGKEVTVLGSGASAIDLAAALHEAGAFVRIVARGSRISFHSSPSDNDSSLWTQLRRPSSGIGPGWRSYMYVHAPLLFHRLPEQVRLRVVKNHLGPAPGWFMRERVEGRIKTLLAQEVARAEAKNGHVVLDLTDKHTGEVSTITCDHVIAATGYRTDLAKLPFMRQSLVACIDKVENTPILSDNFETSVPGLYVTGPAAASSFGPLLRFMFGAGFASPRLAGHLARAVRATTTRRAA